MNITPGEWKCHPIPDTDGHVWEVETHYTSIATVSLSYNTPGNCSQTEANAKLIASAPDLYEALKLYLKHQEGTRGHYCGECARAINLAVEKVEANK